MGHRIGLIGCGNMGRALIDGLIAAGALPAKDIVASAVDRKRLDAFARTHGIEATTDNLELVSKVDVIILAVKPQAIEKVLALVGPRITKKHLVVSVLAGTSTSF